MNKARFRDREICERAIARFTHLHGDPRILSVKLKKARSTLMYYAGGENWAKCSESSEDGLCFQGLPDKARKALEDAR